nr:MAG TPA: hypothetical protein [Bacteriophage sp.]
MLLYLYSSYGLCYTVPEPSLLMFVESKLIMSTASFCSSIADIGFCTSVDTMINAKAENMQQLADTYE